MMSLMTTECRYTADRGFKEEYSQRLEGQIRERKENEDKEKNMSREYAKQLVSMHKCFESFNVKLLSENF